MVARILEMPLQSYTRYITHLESTPEFTFLRGYMDMTQLSETTQNGTETSRSLHALGIISNSGDGLAFHYAHPVLHREYRFNEPDLARWRGQNNRDLLRMVGRLRLVNTRNRLTHSLLQVVLEKQGRYLCSGDPVDLNPLTQMNVAAGMQARATYTHADTSRVSRLMRNLTIHTPQGRPVQLRSLCPGRADLHAIYLSRIFKQEQVALIEGRLTKARPDREIAQELRRQTGIELLPRSIGYIRDKLGVPSARERCHRSRYLKATAEFSPVWPLSEKSLHAYVPAGPGLYELRCRPDIPEQCPVIYLGSTHNLRKRLLTHLRGWNRNNLLQDFLNHSLQFRIRPLGVDWRAAERALYKAFCATFGEAPLANRMSP